MRREVIENVIRFVVAKPLAWIIYVSERPN